MKVFTLLFIIVMLVGCASTSVNLYKDNLSYEPTDYTNVKVFQKIPQDRKFTELGEITVSQVYSWKKVEKALKKKVAELGGDAVYIVNRMDKQEGGMVGQYGAIDTQLIITGVAIKYE